MTELMQPTRRTALKATAWSAPAVAISLAAPAYASSPSASLYALVVPATSPLEGAHVTLSIDAAALPLSPGSVALRCTRESGTATLKRVSFTGTWTYAWLSEGLLTLGVEFYASTATQSYNSFIFEFTGPSTWLVTLTTPDGVLSHRIEALDTPAARTSTPVPEDPSHLTSIQR